MGVNIIQGMFDILDRDIRLAIGKYGAVRALLHLAYVLEQGFLKPIRMNKRSG